MGKKKARQLATKLRFGSANNKKGFKSVAKGNSVVSNSVVKNNINIPMFVKQAIDIYINKLSYDDVAKKYNRTKQQVMWLNSKSIKMQLNELWWLGHERNGSRLKVNQSAPLYMQMAADILVNNMTLADVAKKYHKSKKTVNLLLNQLKQKIPYMWNLMNNNSLI